MPRELLLLKYVDRFGLGVLGRPPGAGELRRMSMAERVLRAYQEMHHSENWAAWAEKHPSDAKLLEIGASYGE
jgi:hypothetical protein